MYVSPHITNLDLAKPAFDGALVVFYFRLLKMHIADMFCNIGYFLFAYQAVG